MSERGFGIRAMSAALGVLATIVLVACGGDDSDTSDDGTDGEASASSAPVSMAIGPWIGYGPWWVAEEMGFDQDNGVDLELKNISTDSEISTSFASGQLDAANLPTHSTLRLAGAGFDAKVVLFEDISLEGDAVLGGPDVASVADLAGKDVAYEEGSVSDILIRYALDQEGLTVDDLNTVPLAGTDAGTAVVAGRVDAAATYEPFVTGAVEESNGDVKVVFTAAERPGLISDLLLVQPEFADENPDAVAGLLGAWADGLEYYESNTKEAQEIIAKNIGAKPEELAASFDGVDLFDLEQSQAFLEGDFVPLAEDLTAILEEQGELQEAPDVESIVDTSFGDQALGE